MFHVQESCIKCQRHSILHQFSVQLGSDEQADEASDLNMGNFKTRTTMKFVLRNARLFPALKHDQVYKCLWNLSSVMPHFEISYSSYLRFHSFKIGEIQNRNRDLQPQPRTENLALLRKCTHCSWRDVIWWPLDPISALRDYDFLYYHFYNNVSALHSENFCW